MMGQQMNPMLMRALMQQQGGGQQGQGGPVMPTMPKQNAAPNMAPMTPPAQAAPQPGLIQSMMSNPMAMMALASMGGGGAGAAGAAGAAKPWVNPDMIGGAGAGMPMPSAGPWQNPDMGGGLGVSGIPIAGGGPQLGGGGMPMGGGGGMPPGLNARIPSNMTMTPGLQEWLRRLSPGSVVR